jgi:hypothetical protein
MLTGLPDGSVAGSGVLTVQFHTREELFHTRDALFHTRDALFYTGVTSVGC